MKPSIAIIGAGLAGLTVARQLTKQADIVLFDKSRGVGGRLATRYADPYQFDHGTQHFTAKTESFQAFLEPLLQQGIVARWDARFVEMQRHQITSQRQWSSDHPHYVGVPKMNAIGKYLASGLEVHTGCRITEMRRHDGRWHLSDEAGESHGPYDWVICTAPAQQASELLPATFSHHARLSEIKLLGCYALMVGLKAPLSLGFDAALVKQADISWISVNSSKPARQTDCSLLIHATNAWAERHMEDEIEAVQTHLLHELSEVIGHDMREADHVVTHRWRYANIAKQEGPSALIDTDHQLIACGDWCIQGRVEAAFVSAMAAADHLRRI